MKNFDVVKPGRYKTREGLVVEVLQIREGDDYLPDMRCVGRLPGVGRFWWCIDGLAFGDEEHYYDLVEYLGPLPGESVEPVRSAEGLVESLADAAESAAADFVEAVLKARRELRERLCMQMIRNREHMSADDLFDYADQVATRLEAIQ